MLTESQSELRGGQNIQYKGLFSPKIKPEMWN